MATTFASRPAPPRSPASPGRTEVARRRQAKRRTPLRIPPEADSDRPILWPEEFKRTLPVGRLIRLDSSRPVDVPFFTSLNYDIRRAIYDLILMHAGFHQQIFCPSVSRMGKTKELYSRYLIAKKCNQSCFQSGLVCGHWDCEKNRSLGTSEGLTPEYALADLVTLMRACKFGYLEISEYLYRSVTFTFGSFREMGVFLDRTSDSVLTKIRSVAFIAHALPWDTKSCYRFIRGEFFQTEEEDGIALFQRFPNLEKLQINFYPNQMLAASNQLGVMVKPLDLLPKSIEVTLRIPLIIYGKGPNDDDMYLPPVPKLDGPGRFKLVRPGVKPDYSTRQCRVDRIQLERNQID